MYKKPENEEFQPYLELKFRNCVTAAEQFFFLSENIKHLKFFDYKIQKDEDSCSIVIQNDLHKLKKLKRKIRSSYEFEDFYELNIIK